LKPLPKVAIVILTWNGRKFLEQFLPSVLLSSYSNHEIFVVDNNSADDTIDFLKTHYPAIHIIKNAGNWGFAKGYNEALKQVSADYYVLLNSDVAVTPNWLAPMVKLLESDTSIAACQPKVLAYHNKNIFEYAGAAGGWIDRYGYPFCKGRVFEICEEDHGQYDQAEPIFWATGAALFIRSSAFHAQKGLDEYFFAHQEEIDLCWRVQLAGGKIYSCPSAVVYHVGGGTLQRGNSKKTFLNFRNNLIMLAKNWPLSKKLWALPVRISLDAIAAWRGLLTGDAGYFWAIVKAHFAFANWLLFYQQKSHFPLSRKGQLKGVLPKNLVWQFFINQKKTFSKIVNKT
jgi:GT2 family glycosyltransferase